MLYVITGSKVLFDDVIKSRYPPLSVEVAVHDGRTWGIIRGGIGIEPNIQTPLHNPRIVICSESNSSVTFKFEAAYVLLVCGRLLEDNEHFHELVQTLLPESGYFLCQGLHCNYHSHLFSHTLVVGNSLQHVLTIQEAVCL